MLSCFQPWWYSRSFRNIIGYWLERKVVIIYTIKKTLLVQEKYLVQSKDFFEKTGGRAIIFARFYQYLEHLHL
jgi:membrane protein DedA with SNARE-associated domain